MNSFKTDRDKLDRIADIVGEIFGKVPMSSPIYGDLMSIDSICDEPLDGEF